MATMKIAKAMKIISRLKGEIKLIDDRIQKCVSAPETNEFTENLAFLTNVRVLKVEELIKLKVKVMEKNIQHGKFEIITTLSELKNTIVLYKDLEIKSGIVQVRYETTNLTYKTQLTIAEREAHITQLQHQINDMTDELDIFNASTDIEL